MSNLPRYILRDCMLWADRASQLGQIGEIQTPELSRKMEEMRNAGMIKARDVSLGYEKLGFGFKMPTVDPKIITLYGLKVGSENPFMITGALVDEDGTTHSAVMNIRGFMNKFDAGAWKPGSLAESDYQVSVNYYKLEIDGVNLLEVDDFDIKINGVSQYSDIRNALLLN